MSKFKQPFPKPIGVTTMGFWLPCGRTNFFSHHDDQPLLQEQILELNSLDISFASRMNQKLSNDDLQSSVFRRLSIVLRERGFSRIYPIIRENYSDESDPESVLFVSEEIPENQWPDTFPRPYGLVLIVNDEGFYMWLAIHGQGENEQKTMQEALRKYIADQMVGGAYYSHASISETKNQERLFDSQIDQQSLDVYRKQKLGILNFFQLNLILEGLFNYMLDDSIYFHSSKETENVLWDKESKYSLGAFADLITGIVEFKRDSQQYIKGQKDPETAIAQKISRLFAGLYNKNTSSLIAKEMIETCITDQVRRDLLRRFLRTTAAESLQQLKWRLERCRRTLLKEMISVMHLQRSLHQVESPDLSAITGMREATEDQLRGYVMLTSAKLPLIRNVQRYLDQVIHSMVYREQAKSKLPQPEAYEASVGEIKAYIDSWSGIYEAIVDNIHGLENAIDEARDERSFEEEHKIRTEQESIAEIERIRQHTGYSEGGRGGTTDESLGFSENVFALLSLVVTLLTIGEGANGIDSLHTSIMALLSFVNSVSIRNVAAFSVVYIILTFAGLVAYFLVVYPLVHGSFKIAKWFINLIRPFRKLYYYEFDVRIDQPLSFPFVRELVEHKGTYTRSDLGGAKPFISHTEKNAYRVEVENLEEGDYKLHFSAKILWPRTFAISRFSRNFHIQPWRWRITQTRFLSSIFIWLKITHIEMIADITYELFHHQPSGVDSFLFREFRVMTTHTQRLSTGQLRDLKDLVSQKLINPWLEEKYRITKDHPLFTLVNREII